MNTALLEDQLRLLRLNPIFENVEASLRAGSEIGKSVLLVRIKEANPFVNSFTVDNLSPPPVGSQRAGVTLGWQNLTGLGDDILGSFYISDGDSQVYDFSYRVPVNAMNGTVQYWPWGWVALARDSRFKSAFRLCPSFNFYRR